MAVTAQDDLQAAVDGLVPHGGALHLGGDDYTGVTDLTMPPCPVVLDGPGATLVGDGGTAIWPNPDGQLTIRGLTFDGYDTAVQFGAGDHAGFTAEGCTFTTDYAGVDANGADVLADASIRDCDFAGMEYGFRSRGARTRRCRFEHTRFENVGFRGAILGGGYGNALDQCHFEGVTAADSRHVIGLLSYAADTTVRDCGFRDIYGPSRHEAASIRGDGSTVRDCTFVNAGGAAGAISVATHGRVTLDNNTIEFDDDHPGSRDGIDVRRAHVKCVNNDITGWHDGIDFRRGGRARVSGNHLHASAHADRAISLGMATGAVVPERHMGKVTVAENQVYDVQAGGTFRAIAFDLSGHGGDADTRMDDLVVTDNIVTEVDASPSRGVQFYKIHQADSHVARAIVANNDLDCDQPVHASVQNGTDVVVTDNTD